MVFVRFFTVKFLFFSSPFHIVLSGEQSLCPVRSIRSGELRYPFLKAEYLHQLFGVLCGRFVSSPLFIQLSNHLLISVWTHRYLFCILGYNPILLYYVAQIIPALAVGNSFSQCSHSFDILSLVHCPPHPHCALLLFEPSSHYGTAQCSRLILCVSCSSPRISHFSKEP